MQILSTDDILTEVEADLHKSGITTERYVIACNSVDSGGSDLQVISVAAGAAIALISQALSAFISRKTGQRKIVVRKFNQNDEVIHIEVETPRLDEIEKLLKTTYEVHLIDTSKDTNETEQDAAATP